MAEDAILTYLDKNELIVDSGEFAVAVGISHEEIVNAIKSLMYSKSVNAQDIKKESCKLTDEGKTYAAKGSPEYQLFMAIPPEGITIVELQKKLGDTIFKIGCQQANKNRWVKMGKSQASRKVEHVDDNVKDMLVRINDGEALNQEDIDALKRRKLISLQIWKGYSVKKGPAYALKRTKRTTDLTREHMQRFEEMPTNQYVVSSLENFDALFTAQQHPARDLQDTFFLKVPSTTKTLPEDYVERVKRMHESGGHGSRGYRYEWKREEASKNVLRTHTTAVSVKMLRALAAKEILGCSDLKCYSVLPMGFPKDVGVIAWGLSLERPTMILYGIDNIRDIFGHKVNLSFIERNPICRMGLEYSDKDEIVD
ncbi:phenylalanyl-tRNA synthetase [Artemisia annua]|uniref:Phenylalanyl-tRNA synthetase n=1 Tax=Artemisia annua TaxID=35608 RepID=A0A2U1MCK8_ARTAN|nr:phenylalanyl-tRNA synthetase [Artemisia annua]